MTQATQKAALCALSAIFLATAATACNGTASDALNSGNVQGTDNLSANPGNIPSGSKDPGAGSPPSNTTSNVVGDSCQTSDPQHLCVALKYVPYEGSNGQPVVSQSDAITNVRGISQEWSQCNIGFQIEDFKPVNPVDLGLNYRPANDTELDPIRSALSDNKTMLVVTTGTWNRNGTLGNTGANAWTNMPGGDVFGAILESPVGTFPLIIAHELGHYMNLDHVSDSGDLMNPIIYDTSTTLSASQCDTARSAVNYFWHNMKR